VSGKLHSDRSHILVGHLLKAKVGLLLFPSLTMTRITIGMKITKSGLKMTSADDLSPCVQVCKLDSDFVCKGCGRTIEEVLKWPEYTDEQKLAVLNRLFDNKG